MGAYERFTIAVMVSDLYQVSFFVLMLVSIAVILLRLR